MCKHFFGVDINVIPGFLYNLQNEIASNNKLEIF